MQLFVKTSTGFFGPTKGREDVKIIRSVVGDDMLIKAAGGVRTLQSIEDFIEAGGKPFRNRSPKRSQTY